MNIHSVTAFFIAALSTLSVAASADLKVPDKVDVGRIKGNELHKFEFTIKNTSDVNLEITKVASSCSCTNVKLDGSETLAPGAERIVSGDVNFGGTLGSYETKVTIDSRSKSGNIQTAMVPIRGQVIAALVLEKTYIDFGEVDLAATPQVVTIEAKRGNSGEEWDTIQAESENKYLNVMVEKDSEKVFHITIRFNPSGLPISIFRGAVKLRLLQKDQLLPDKIELPITARIKGPLKATPASIYLGAIAPGQTLERAIIVSSSKLDLREMTIEKQPHDGLAIIEDSEEGVDKISVRVAPTVGNHTFTEMLVLLHKPSGIRLNIPILGTVKNADSQQ